MLARWGWVLVVAVVFGLAPGAVADESCCMQPLSYFDCTGSGHFASPGRLYTCVETSEMKGCMSCLRNDDYSNVTCSACCSVAGDTDCDSINSEWEFYASTLFFICLCCCFTALCGFTEIRRKKKGISFAQAWSVPQAMPVLRTWPRGSSDSDMNHTDGESPWAVLSDNEDELKRYPVAGLVDDSGIAFGFASSMPQSLLSSVTTALGRSASPAPPLPQEPELTLWVSREHAGSSTSTNGGPVGAVEASTPEGSSSRSREPSRLGRGQQRAVVVGNDLEEPLMLDGTGPGRGEGQTGGANVPSAAEPDGRTET